MENLPPNPTPAQVEDEIAFMNVLLATLDPSDDDYTTRQEEIHSEIRSLEGLAQTLPAVSNHNGHTSMDASYRSDSPPLPPSSASLKRPPSSSFLGSNEVPSKRPTPDASRSATPLSFPHIHPSNHASELNSRAVARQRNMEAQFNRQKEETQQDAEMARRMNSQQGPSFAASSSQPRGIQMTLNHKGGYQRPPQPVKQDTVPMLGNVNPPPFNSNGVYNFPPIKHEPIHTQQLPSISAAGSSFVDLTNSDSDPEEPTPNFPPPIPSIRAPHSRASPINGALPNQQTYTTPGAWPFSSMAQLQMPGAWPSPHVTQSYGGQTSSPFSVNTPSRLVREPPPAQNIYSRATPLTNYSPMVGRRPGHYSDLITGNTSISPWELDSDEDDDDFQVTGSRHNAGMPFGGYAGNEDLYRTRYEAFQQYDPTKSREEIQALLANIRPDEEMPAHLRAQTPEAMTIQLHKYQELGLTWLQQCEDGSNKGGILADDMGLGKTIQMLSLIVTHKSTDPRCKTTLIVAPLALMRQWEQEIRSKIKPGRHALSVFTHHGSAKAKNFTQLQHYDIVLTTYGSLASELKSHEKAELERRRNPNARIADRSILLAQDAKWYRVILDEAQCIKNRTTQTSKGACVLKATYRFCVTGTPMMNNVEELFSLIRFLKIKPYDTWEKFRMDFKQPLAGPYESARERAMQMLQALCKAIMLRRTKKSTFEGKPILVLPERSTTVDNPVFSDDEKAFYDALEGRTQLEFNRYLRRGTVGKSYSAILVLLLRLRQACCHPHLIKDFGVSAASDLSEDQLIGFAKQLDDAVVARIKATNGSFECPVCYDVTPNPAIFLPCGHDTCSECFARIADAAATAGDTQDGSTVIKCPNCRTRVDPKKLTDFTSFKKVYMPELLTDAELETMGVDDSSDSSDDDSDSSEEEDESEDETDSLDGFIVNDDEVEEEEAEDDDDLDTKNVKLEAQEEDQIKAEDSDDSDDLDLPVKREESSVVKPELSAKAKGKQTMAGPSSMHQSKLKLKKKKKKSSKRTKTEDESEEVKSKSKGKGKANKKRKPAVTLAELKKLASRNTKAKRAYLRQLRKTYVSSAKIDKTMDILRDIMADPEGEKVLIFSQWTSLLDLLEIPVDEAGIQYRRYDGSMNAKMRGDAVDDFRDTSKNVRVMLVSLKAGNAGLNLNMASQVIILDPFWNPYIEEQAIDRAHRIGQTRPVQVHRVLIGETVEDRIIELQEKKRQLISEALDEKSHSAIARLGVQELAYLFGVTNNVNQRVEYQAR